MNRINVSADIKVNVLEKNYKHYLNRSVILFGASNSGKSTILKEILFLLKPHVPLIFIFCPTADDNNDYEGIVPSSLIFKSIDLNHLESIHKRQSSATKIYNFVNKIDSLRNLFNKCATRKDVDKVKHIYANADSIVRRYDNNNEKASKMIEVRKIRDGHLIKLFKNIIRSNKQKLMKIANNSEKVIITYLDFNPNCVVIFDDCGAELKKFHKSEVYRKIMYQGRHSNINILLTLQDDTGLDAGVKKNAFVNIFTTPQCANAYFARSNSSFLKKEKEKANKIISSVFSGGHKYRKLAYIRDDNDPFRYTIADEYGSFKFGSDVLWKLCDRNNSDDWDPINDPSIKDFIIF